ncbi:hypothetical protein A2960_00970 [Candidatus Gottesmanbacteria bacterium RIFCSPLOWO2_01_FULL_39_12b]|uniref:NAD-dependent epimerase/dehydratase domain-containing protein n=1 Tax=Candidatus Gottesmanbacteria bacterium RIFCSPLOWO2_01_FULL_39_12b TaxID=1798388 RepID=A0A1F6APY3_9BACT|nr:MAG: hypothetical protein A2960_00970 [Candidatus Gottesmanbacteria bacterium RIFCSPLOWO2_01_FULL_39_12b]
MSKDKSFINKLNGPIAVFGAGGFIGFNLLQKLLERRQDVLGLSHDPKNSWRIKESPKIQRYIQRCDVLNILELKTILNKYKPQTIFNLAAYGAYSDQQNIEYIYSTNFNSTISIIEILKRNGFKAYIHAGSQSEYGLNSSGPFEDNDLIPNSHYAVAKVASHYLIKYYGLVEKLPVIHLRFYSVYGPWEEKGRLIKTIIEKAKNKKLPDFVDPNVTHDFIYIDDVIEAIIISAVKVNKKIFGEVFNVATGKKTSIKEIAFLAKKIFRLTVQPKFNRMQNRLWDMADWYGNSNKALKVLGWQAKVSLTEGLIKTYQHKYG